MENKSKNCDISCILKVIYVDVEYLRLTSDTEQFRLIT